MPTYTPQYPNPTTNILSQPYASNGQYEWQMSGPIFYQNYLYMACDGSGPQPNGAGLLKSSDGKRWIAQDVADGPQNTGSTAWFFDGNHTVTVCYSDLNNTGSTTAHITFQDFDLSAGTWGAAYGATGSPTLSNGVQLIASIWKRSDGSIVVAVKYTSSTSKLSVYVYASGSWGSAIDIGQNTSTTFSDAYISGCMDGDDVLFFLSAAPKLFFQRFTAANGVPSSGANNYYQFPGQTSFPYAMDSTPGEVGGYPIKTGSLVILPVSMTRQDISPASYIQVPSLYVLSGTTWTLIGSATGVGIDPNVQTQTTNSPSSIPGFAYVSGTTLYVIYCGSSPLGGAENIIRLCTCTNFTNANPNLWAWTSILANTLSACVYANASAFCSFGYPCYGIANGLNMMTADIAQDIVDGQNYDATFWLGGIFAPAAWLLIDEPPNGLIDRSNYILWGGAPEGLGGSSQCNWSTVLRQRGQANIPLYVPAGDSYVPQAASPNQTGWKCYLQDVEPDGSYSIVFAGTIDTIELSWIGQNGDRMYAMTVVSLEQVLDAILVTLPQYYTTMTADQIVVQLFLLFLQNTQVSLGNIQTGAITIDQFQANNYERVSDDVDTLATTAQYVWGVDPTTCTLYFCEPTSVSAPFTVTSDSQVGHGGIGWAQLEIKYERHDYRNRQIINAGFGAFTDSNELFLGTGGQTVFDLLRPVDTVTNAWITANTQNHATGTFSGQPSAGDTISIGYANSSGSQYAWAPSSPYQVGQVIIDPANHQQVVTTVSGDDKSGSTEPTWNDNGGTTVDHNVTWQDNGLNPFANGNAGTYTFVEYEDLDNTQWGQVVIGSGQTTAEALEQTVLNLIYAINEQIQANGLGSTDNTGAPVKGVNFSLPTWENPLVNAYPVSNGVFKILNKVSGQGYIAALTKSCSNFSWSNGSTTGGSTPFGMSGQTYGPIAVGVAGQSLTGLVYTKGSNVVSLATPLNSGTNLQVQYQRYGGGVVEVEDTALVDSRAVNEDGSGKYQMISSAATAATQGQALQEAQQALAAFDEVPQSVLFVTNTSGLRCGQVVTLAVTHPSGAASVVNGNWYVQEIEAELVPLYGGMTLGQVAASGDYSLAHFQYKVTVIDVAQIGSFLDFWESLGGGGSGGGGSVSGLGAGNGGAFPSAQIQIQFETDGTANVSQSTLNLISGTGITLSNSGIGTSINLSGSGTGTVTSVGLTAPTQFAVTGSPVTTSGTLAIAWQTQTANYVLAGPTSGSAAAPTFRALVAADIPTLPAPGYPFHDEPLTDGMSDFIFAAGDCIVVVGIPN